MSKHSTALNPLTFISTIILFLMLVVESSGQEQKPDPPRFDRSEVVSDIFEPSIPRAEQDQRVNERLSTLKVEQGQRPNVLWIVVDDMGFGDPGCYGGGAAVGASTPNMDHLAANGLKLTSCYAQQTCTPTRSAILTGRLPVRTGLTRPILAGDKISKNP